MSLIRGYQDLSVAVQNDGRIVRLGIMTKTHRIGLAISVPGAAALALMAKKNDELPDRECNLLGSLHISQVATILPEKWPDQVTLRNQFEHEKQAVVWSVRDCEHRTGFVVKMPVRSLHSLFHAIAQEGDSSFMISGSLEPTL